MNPIHVCIELVTSIKRTICPFLFLTLNLWHNLVPFYNISFLQECILCCLPKIFFNISCMLLKGCIENSLYFRKQLFCWKKKKHYFKSSTILKNFIQFKSVTTTFYKRLDFLMCTEIFIIN